MRSSADSWKEPDVTIAERGRAAREIAHAMVAVIVIAAVTIVPMRAIAVTEPVVGDRGSITANSALWGAAPVGQTTDPVRCHG